MDINNITVIINQNGYTAEVKETVKGSAKCQGIQIGAGNIKAVIYPENINVEGTDEEIAKKIIAQYEANKTPEFDIDGITDPEYIKDNLFLAARRPVDDDAFALDYLDIQIVARVGIKTPEGITDASYVIKKDMAEKLHLDESLFQNGIRNMFFDFRPMGTVLGIDESELPDTGLYVVSTKDNLYGASALYDRVFWRSISDLLQSDLVIIPSSTHELLVMRYSDETHISDINEMVREVNSTQVSPTEQLADHAYLYIRKDSKISY